ncbi:MAG: hypothetical protein Q4F84_09420 [Fibrobacter sp.]|nr:hypothetical protein [Fibrobacter sp.]
MSIKNGPLYGVCEMLKWHFKLFPEPCQAVFSPYFGSSREII